MKTTNDLMTELEKVTKEKAKGSDDLADYLLSAGEITHKWIGQDGTCFEVYYEGHYYNLIPQINNHFYFVKCAQ